MQTDLEQMLTEKAKREFGDTRAKELQADIAKVSAELSALQTFAITIHNEI